MTEPIPVNLSAIEARAAKQDARAASARQSASKATFTENVDRAFNPEAAEREQERFDQFRSLESRMKKPMAQIKGRITAVSERKEEDLADNYHRRNPELEPDRLRAARDALRQGQSAEEILEEVFKGLQDATLVDETLEFLEKETRGDIQNNVKKARAILQELRGPEVIAGRNIDSVAKSFSKKGLGETATDLRNLYRSVTGEEHDHNTLFTKLSQRYPFDQLKTVVAFLLKGMAFDLKSKGPSVQEAELMRLMSETRNLQSILWVYLFFKSRMKLIKRLYSQYGGHASEDLTFEMLAKAFIRLVEERYPSVMKLLKLQDKMGLLEDYEKVIILIQYRDAIRQLSPRLYKSLRHRQDLLLVILDALEELEEEEEEEEEEENQ